MNILISSFEKTAFKKAAIVCSSVLFLSGCFWENQQKTQQVSPYVLWEPENADDLIYAVKKAEQRNRSIKMTGSGHSLSDVAVTEDVLLTPQKLNQPLSLDTSRLKPGDHSQLVRVQSGIRIRELNQHLDSIGLALENMGGWDEQTIVGAAMTGTHGSGLNYGPIESQIVSMQVVTSGGQMIQVEPSNGITNPSSFNGRLEEDSGISVQLIQDDDTFNAFKVSVGSMGIVYSVVLQADRKFWIREVREIDTWTNFKASGGLLEQMVNNSFVESPAPDYFEFQYNPYKTGGKNTVLVTRRYKSYDPLPISQQRGQFGADLGSFLVTLFEPLLAAIFAGIVEIVPGVIDTALNAQRDDGYNNISYRVFNIGLINKTDVVANESAFDVSQTVAAVERHMALAESYYADRKVFTSPVAVRFVKSSDALVAMQQGRPTMLIESIMFKDLNYAKPMLNDFQNTMISEFGARPHWGLDWDSQQDTYSMSQVFPRWYDWLGIYNQYNHSGTFNGWVTDRLGISN